MLRALGWAGLFLSAAACLADEASPQLPVPRTAPGVAPPARPILPGVAPLLRPSSELTPSPGDDPARGLEGLRREIERLRSERESLRVERDQTGRQSEESPGPTTSEAAQLRARLAELLLKLGGPAPTAPGKSSEPAPAQVAPALKPPADGTRKPLVGPPEPEKPPPSTPGQIVDPLALAESLFRAGDFEAALATYRLLDVSAMANEEKIVVQYMMACCLRRLGKLEEAATLYREVANAEGAPVLADCAQWHLSNLNGRRDLEAKLQQLRQRRQALEAKP